MSSTCASNQPWEIRAGSCEDVEEIGGLFERDLGRTPDLARIRFLTSKYPSAIAEDAKGKLLGFAFCAGFAPDILELANLLEEVEVRNRGIGAQIEPALKTFQSVCSDCFVYTRASQGSPLTCPAQP